MLRAIRNLALLVRAARIMARHDALLPLEFREEVPSALLALLPVAKLRFPWESSAQEKGLGAAFEALGPSYIKLGQFLSTRPDIIGPELASELTKLQDKLPPFPLEEARAIIETDLGKPVDAMFSSFSPSIAAASIAQVHRARIIPDEAYPEGQEVAVKVLRPGVEARFNRDLDSFFWAAAWIERGYKPSRRLRPIEIVRTLADSVTLEMDFRMEAAAMSEMAENVANDTGFRVPQVDWEHTGKHVLTLEWIDGTAASDREALVTAGHDMRQLGQQIIQSFLTHALRDGFFHADLHQGNLFVDKDGCIVAVDFGIMGRLGPAERRYFAEILYGFVTRDYHRVAEVHFEAGYVPRDKNVDHFAQALRAVGEPIFRRPASDVSMGKLLAQLFDVTAQFDMATRPELILLQKTMMVVEGVARHFDPQNNIWESAEPFLREWVASRMAPETRLEEGAAYVSRTLTQLPDLIARAERTVRLLSESVDEEGVRLHPTSAQAVAGADTPWQRFKSGAFWVLLGVVAALLLF